ncbi:hypothetical protein AMTR_s00067p00126450 [Amborella trichopoda]|uniref:Knottin scorpion toxin-like domain-containing protein n=1 Tax=Amborella trichopoda TaxID=13333 RepID=U5DBN2_AMBTC|nr:hypothetical protein AMTR_s00067p00126450 [Amborella trichopoda]
MAAKALVSLVTALFIVFAAQSVKGQDPGGQPICLGGDCTSYQPDCWAACYSYGYPKGGECIEHYPVTQCCCNS